MASIVVRGPSVTSKRDRRAASGRRRPGRVSTLTVGRPESVAAVVQFLDRARVGVEPRLARTTVPARPEHGLDVGAVARCWHPTRSTAATRYCGPRVTVKTTCSRSSRPGLAGERRRRVPVPFARAGRSRCCAPGSRARPRRACPRACRARISPCAACRAAGRRGRRPSRRGPRSIRTVTSTLPAVRRGLDVGVDLRLEEAVRPQVVDVALDGRVERQPGRIARQAARPRRASTCAPLPSGAPSTCASPTVACGPAFIVEDQPQLVLAGRGLGRRRDGRVQEPVVAAARLEHGRDLVAAPRPAATRRSGRAPRPAAGAPAGRGRRGTSIPTTVPNRHQLVGEDDAGRRRARRPRRRR